VSFIEQIHAKTVNDREQFPIFGRKHYTVYMCDVGIVEQLVKQSDARKDPHFVYKNEAEFMVDDIVGDVVAALEFMFLNQHKNRLQSIDLAPSPRSFVKKLICYKYSPDSSKSRQYEKIMTRLAGT
jgi:hypothetical protein